MIALANHARRGRREHLCAALEKTKSTESDDDKSPPNVAHNLALNGALNPASTILLSGEQ
jgi:hypothetical protein